MVTRLSTRRLVSALHALLVLGVMPIVGLVPAARTAGSQAPSPPAPSRSAWDFGLQVAMAPASRNGGWFGGQAAGATQTSLTLLATRDLVRVGPLALRWVAQLDPVVRLGDVEAYTAVPGSFGPIYVLSGTTTAWGAVLVPLAIAGEVAPASRVRLAMSTGVGVAAFSRNVPTAAGRQRNFIAQVEASALVRIGRAQWLEGGLRLRHVSNGYTGWENPGVDSRLVFLGVRIGGR